MPRGTLTIEQTLKVCWINMRQRCNNPRQPSYKHYGGRGITICKEWQESFAAFYHDMVDSWQRGLEIERRDNEGNYNPVNCYWATHKENLGNRRNGWTNTPEQREHISKKLKAAWDRGCYDKVEDRSGKVSKGLKKYYAKRKADGLPAMTDETRKNISDGIKAHWVQRRKEDAKAPETG